MKNRRNFLSFIICISTVFCLLLSFFTVAFAQETTTLAQPPFNTSFVQGDTIEFGSYPQSLVTDEALIEELGWYIEDDMWQSIGWYRGDGTQGSMYEADTAKYCDISYYGEMYRAVTFSEHRAYETTSLPTSSMQAPLGYTPDNIYYFKFEPIKWRILDPSNGLVIAESILDAPAYQNNSYQGATRYMLYSDAEFTLYASDWEHSTLREFLNGKFADTAFSAAESSLIGEIELTNSVVTNGDEEYSGNNTTDRVFILSINEIGYDDYYGLSDELRVRNGTDYAHLHGLYAGTLSQGEGALYYLRTPAAAGTVCYVSEKGVIASSVNANSQDMGVVPSLCIDLETYEALDLYEGISISFNNGVLTVSGNGTLPDPESSVTKILAPYAEKTTAVIIEDGITAVDTNAFDGFIELKTVICKGEITLRNDSFPDSFQLSTMILKADTVLSENPFSADIFYLNIFGENTADINYDNPSDNVKIHSYAFTDNTLEVTGEVTMNSYEFFDFIAAMCEDYAEIEEAAFSSFTSTDLAFYTYNEETGERELIEDSHLSDAVFSVEILTNGEAMRVSFNTLCEKAADGTLEEFCLLTKSEAAGEIEDTEMEINSLEDLITYALKWIVSLLNFFFSLFSR